MILRNLQIWVILIWGNMIILSNTKNWNEETRLLYAAKSRNISIVDKLNKYGADIYAILITYSKGGRWWENKIENGLCNSSRKEFSGTVKFCNYCGQRISEE